MKTFNFLLFVTVFYLLNINLVFGQTVSGSGSEYYIPIFTGANAIGNSLMSQDAGATTVTINGIVRANQIQSKGGIGSYSNTDLALLANGINNKITFSIGSNESMRINSSGQVLINSTCATLPTDCKLAVNWTIYTTNVNIKLTNCWSDFVFKKEYGLLPIHDLEKFINTNGHLPGIPSDKEVQENGIDVARINALLLQKIEELTLYIIEQDKKIMEQDRKIEKIQEKLNHQ